MKKYESIQLIIICLAAGLCFPACTALPYVASEHATPSSIPTQLATEDIYPVPQDCQKINSAGLPVGHDLQNSHILYLAGKDIDNLNQLWVLDVENGFRKMLLDTSDYHFYAVGFLQDKAHFVMAGSEKFWLSDLSGSQPQAMELTSQELSVIISNNFPLYSRIARGYNSISSSESPDGIKKAIWNLGDPSLVIIDDRTQQHTDVINYDNRGYIQGNWSPDGEHYAFSYSKPFQDEYSKVYLIEADGSHLRELVRYKSANIGRPYWSPDGTKIAYAITKQFAFRPTYYQILTIATGESKIYGINAEESLAFRNGNDIVWSPDSEWLLLFGRNSNPDQIDINALKISNGEFYCVTDDSLVEIMVDWR